MDAPRVGAGVALQALGFGGHLVADVVAAGALFVVGGVEPGVSHARIENERAVGAGGGVAIDSRADAADDVEVHGKLVHFPAHLAGAAEDVGPSLHGEGFAAVGTGGIAAGVEQFEIGSLVQPLLGDRGLCRIDAGGAEQLGPVHHQRNGGDRQQIVYGAPAFGTGMVHDVRVHGPVGGPVVAPGCRGREMGWRSGLGEHLRGKQIRVGVHLGRAESSFHRPRAQDGGAGDADRTDRQRGVIGRGDGGRGGSALDGDRAIKRV